MMSSDPNGTGNTAVLPVAASFSAEDKRSHLVQLVLDSVTSPHSKRAYRTGLEQFFSWWAATATAEPLVQCYRSQLEEQGKAPATVNQALAPFRKLSEEASSLLEFWNTNCGPCREEMPKLKALDDSLPRSRFDILGVTSNENPRRC